VNGKPTSFVACLEINIPRTKKNKIRSPSSPTMMSSKGGRTLLKAFPFLKEKIQKVQQEVLGYAPPSFGNQRTGIQWSKKQLKGVYHMQYYDGNPDMDEAVRDVIPGWQNEMEERRAEKRSYLKRIGKGAPKKGAGKKKKK
jgi:Mitochondrial ribosomal subunit S27